MSRFWQHFVNNGRRQAAPSYLGIQGYAVRLDQAASATCKVDEGVLVRMVQPCSIAEDSGILEGDIIVSVGDHPVGTCDELFGIVEVMPAELPVLIVVVRAGRRFERLLVMPGRRRKLQKG